MICFAVPWILAGVFGVMAFNQTVRRLDHSDFDVGVWWGNLLLILAIGVAAAVAAGWLVILLLRSDIVQAYTAGLLGL